MMLDLSDEEIIKLVLNGDYNAYSILITRYEAKLRSYIGNISNLNHPDVDDLLQDIFIDVFKNLNSFNSEFKFSSWIYSISRNKTISFWKKYKKRHSQIEDNNMFHLKLLSTIDEIDNSIVELEKHKIKEELKIIIDQLDLIYREIIILYYFEEKSYKEIAFIIKKPINTVGVLISRAKKQIKKLVSENDNINKLRNTV